MDTKQPSLPALREAVATIAARRQSGSSSFPREGGVVIYSTDLLGEKAVSDLVGAAPALLDELERVRKEPCACACHSVGGHTDEPTMGMALEERVKDLERRAYGDPRDK